MKDKEQLETLLRSFYLSSFVRNYDDFAKKAEKEKLGYVAYLSQLSLTESSERQTRRTERLINQAKLPRGKTLDGFDLTKQPTISLARLKELAEGECLDQCENILIFGIPGAGKTHLAASLAREWCLRGRRVLFTTAASLVQDLLTAKKNLQLNQHIKRLDRYEALVIDDISYIPYNREETDVLFILLAERYETRSVVVTSNLVFSQWDTVFKDPMTTRAAIDRLVHHATILELNQSFRQQEAEKRQNKLKKSNTNQEPKPPGG